MYLQGIIPSCYIDLSRVKTLDVGFMAPDMTVTYTGQNGRSELDTDQGKGIWNQLKFSAEQLNDRVHFYTSLVLVHEYSNIPTSQA